MGQENILPLQLLPIRSPLIADMTANPEESSMASFISSYHPNEHMPLSAWQEHVDDELKGTFIEQKITRSDLQKIANHLQRLQYFCALHSEKTFGKTVTDEIWKEAGNRTAKDLEWQVDRSDPAS